MFGGDFHEEILGPPCPFWCIRCPTVHWN
jgi:hypothetical protein